MAIKRQDEILGKALESDIGVVPRWDILRPDGSKAEENVQLTLKNPVLQEGIPYSAQVVNELLAASGTTAGISSALTLAQPGFVLRDGAEVKFKLHIGLAPPVTLNVENTGAYSLLGIDNTPFSLRAPAGAYLTAIYNGAAYIVQNSGAPTPKALLTATNVTLNRGGTLVLNVSGIDLTKYDKLYLELKARPTVNPGDDTVYLQFETNSSNPNLSANRYLPTYESGVFSKPMSGSQSRFLVVMGKFYCLGETEKGNFLQILCEMQRLTDYAYMCSYTAYASLNDYSQPLFGYGTLKLDANSAGISSTTEFRIIASEFPSGYNMPFERIVLKGLERSV